MKFNQVIGIKSILFHTYLVSETDGLCPYQAVVLWYPVPGTIIADIIVAIFKVGQTNMNSSNNCCSYSKTFPLSLNLFYTGILLGSWTGSG